MPVVDDGPPATIGGQAAHVVVRRWAVEVGAVRDLQRALRVLRPTARRLFQILIDPGDQMLAQNRGHRDAGRGQATRHQQQGGGDQRDA